MNFCQNGIKLVKEALSENIQEYNVISIDKDDKLLYRKV